MKSLQRIAVYLVLTGGAVGSAIQFGRYFQAVIEAVPGTSKSAMMAWLGGFFACAMLLGLRIAADVGRGLGRLTEGQIIEGEPPEVVPEELQEADRLLKERRPLEAINLLREFLETHPREHFAQFRIAEIYADQLRNPLAAALEYEQLLTHKLDAERWGWAAVRLARMYRLTRDFDKAEALLQRVIKERPKTSAARKAEKLMTEWTG